jgi:hypothetical protein
VPPPPPEPNRSYRSSLHKGEFPSLKDDLQWMPIGPACGAKRQGMNTCKRHRKGWLSFAGGGANSRRLEMFVGLADTGHGGPPHEVGARSESSNKLPSP